jgi:hypothetical protein
MSTGLTRAMKAKRWYSELAAGIGARLIADSWLYLAIGAYCLVGLAIMIVCQRSDQLAYSLYFGQWTYLFLLFMPALALLFDWAWTVVRFDEKRSMAMRRALSPRRLAHMLSGMALLMGLMLFQGTFTSIKNILPHLRGGFLYDRLLADIDRWFSFGKDPWLFFSPLAGNGVVLAIIDWNYSGAWFLLCFGALFYVVTSPRAAAIRVRYVSMFMLAWVVCGNILAGLFLSAGPVFYGAVTGDHQRFAGQSSLLAAGDWSSNAARFQHYLWSIHQSGSEAIGSGISAFPSVHVGLIAVNAFFIAEMSRKAGAVAFAYVAMVMASSVFLGWHYAIDGYASVLVVAVMHYVLKRLMWPTPRERAGISSHDAGMRARSMHTSH